MKVNLHKTSDKEILVDIRYQEINDTISALKRHVEKFDKRLLLSELSGMNSIHPNDVYYVETIDSKTFVYTRENTYEVKSRLYELLELLSDFDFFHISKSAFLYLDKVKRLEPELNRTMIVTLANEEEVYISRKYTKELKNRIDGVKNG